MKIKLNSFPVEQQIFQIFQYAEHGILESQPHVVTRVAQQTRKSATNGGSYFTDQYKSIPPKIEIDSFFVDSLSYTISPPIKFQCSIDVETNFVEMVGDRPYDNIMVYGETVDEARDVLEKEIFPILWGDVNGKDVKLSAKAKKIKVDLKRRVKI